MGVHFSALLRILRYLHGTSSRGLKNPSSSSHNASKHVSM